MSRVLNESADPQFGFAKNRGLLIDTNLLVLFIVGSVNLGRVDNFKRTSKYSQRDFRPLRRAIDPFSPLYTLAHVMAEVSSGGAVLNFTHLQAHEWGV